MSGIEPERGTQHGSLKVGAGAGALGDSDFMGQTVFFFPLPGEASAVLAKAKAKAEAIRILASALTQHVRGWWVGVRDRNRRWKGCAHLRCGEFLTLWAPY